MPNSPSSETHIVMSVPHNGTRTLQTHLAETRKLKAARRDTLGSWHFNFHPKYCAKFFLYAEAQPGTRKAYIPVRNPIDVADSWERRYGDASDKGVFEMTSGYGLMFQSILMFPEHIEIFKIEDLPVLRGIGPSPEGWERIPADHPRVAGLRGWIRGLPKVESFYRGMYTAEELWWL